jgi:DNA-binding transcriptional MerR regulator
VNVNDLLTIGQFSRMCWLSVKALRLYDESGLLHPAHVDPISNYRYYTEEQAPVARAIAILRTLDMSLAEIREIVTASDQEKVRAHLDAHRALLADRIDRDRYMLERVENFIRKGAVVTYNVKLKELEPTDVVGLTFKTSPESISDDGAKAMNRLLEGLNRGGIAPAGPPRWVYHAMDEDSWTIEACFPVVGVSGAPEGLTLRRFEGGRAATALHVGPYDELGMAYRELEVWIGKQGLRPAGRGFDIYLNDPTEVKDPAKFETEIAWPVESA